ncbi:MAG TPA: hypothetical protein VK400_14875 [Pyrinomonadaceae bacterium]|nr:hypothetical protein [Pyrinomonadaceae bacterium]
MSKKTEKKSTDTKETKNTKASKDQLESADEKLPQQWVEFKKNELVIKFDNEHQILPKLLELAQHFSESQTDFASRSGAFAAAIAQNVLGGARARQIVSNCGQSTAWGATLAQLALNPLIFRQCVATRVNQAGYIPPANIPASSDTRLIDVVYHIQGAPLNQ